MSAGLLVAVVCYTITHLLLLAVGVVFFIRNRPMPYHLDALGVPLDQLPPGARVLLRNSVGLLGGSWTALALAQLTIVAIPLSAGELWARLLVPAAGLIHVTGLLRAMTRIGGETSGRPPTPVGWLALALLLGGFAASWF